MSPTILLRCFLCATVSALTVRCFLGPMHHSSPFGVLGTDVPVEFGRFAPRAYLIWELAIFALMGILGGLAGAAFNAVNLGLSRWRQAHVGPRGLRRFLEVVLVTSTIATVNFWVPIAGGASDMSHYSLSQRLFTESGNMSIKRLFHEGERYDLPMLVIFVFIHFAEACWTYGLGVPSGLFVPSLLAGAAWGRIVGQLIDPLEEVKSEAGVYALIGATAALSGMARITISLAVILMETTGEAEWGLPIFITTLAAKWTGDLFNHGLYDIHIHLKKVPLLEGQPEKHMLLMRAADVMSRNVVTLPTRVLVGDLVAVLGSCTHNGFPALDPETKCLAGLIERRALCQLLALGRKYKAFRDSARLGDPPAALVPQEEMLQRSVPSLHEVSTTLSLEDMQREIDLRPYVSAGCFRVEESTGLLRCYMLFRTMGLRHLPVVGHDRRVCGIITRKDLVFEEGGEGATEPAGGGQRKPELAGPPGDESDGLREDPPEERV